MKLIAFINPKGGVGRTTLVYHLAWMFADMGLRVVAADLDPQASLTMACLSDDRLELLWPDASDHRLTVLGAVRPIIEGTGDVADPHLEPIDSRLTLLAGDIGVSAVEGEVARAWPLRSMRDERPRRLTTMFSQAVRRAADLHQADVVLLDLAPNLGAVNRTLFLDADRVVVPLLPDMPSLKGLKILGTTFRRWRQEWSGDRGGPASGPSLAGYVLTHSAIRLDRPPRQYDASLREIARSYRADLLGQGGSAPAPHEDPNCLGILRNYWALMTLAHLAKKPMFHLRAADGALGAHAQAVQACYQDFKALAQRVAEATGVTVPGAQTTLFSSP